MDAQVLARMPLAHLLAVEWHRIIDERKRKATTEVFVTRQEAGA